MTSLFKSINPSSHRHRTSHLFLLLEKQMYYWWGWSFKYSYFAKPALVTLLLYDNSVLERGLSVSKNLLKEHNVIIAEDALDSIRMIKDFLIQGGGYLKFEIKMM